MFNGNTYDQEKTYEDGKQFADDDKLLVKLRSAPAAQQVPVGHRGSPDLPR